MNVTEPRADAYIATNLQAVLDHQGRRQDWLAQQVGVSKTLIGKVLRGERVLMREPAERAAAALGVPFFVLFELRGRSTDAAIAVMQEGDPA